MNKTGNDDGHKEVDLHTMWNDDSDSAPGLPIAEIHKRARRRQLMGDIDFYGGCVSLVILLSLVGWGLLRIPDGLMRLSLFMTALGGAFIIAFYVYHRRVDKRISHNPSAACLSYYKAYLERRIWLMRHAWAWVLAPIVPGLALAFYCVNQNIQHPIAGAQLAPESATLIFHVCEAVAFLTFAGLLLKWNLQIRARSKELEAITASHMA